MNHISFTVHYKYAIPEEVYEKVKTMHKEGYSSVYIVRYLRDTLRCGLYSANAIRKVILQGTTDFDCII